MFFCLVLVNEIYLFSDNLKFSYRLRIFFFVGIGSYSLISGCHGCNFSSHLCIMDTAYCNYKYVNKTLPHA